MALHLFTLIIFIMKISFGDVLSGIGVVGDVASGVLGLNAQQKANEANIALAREQMQWQEKMWNKQNEYNTPSAQMERFRAAGINPYLAMTSMQSGNSSTLPAVSSLPQVHPEDYSFVGNTLGRAADIAMKKEQVAGLQMDNKAKAIGLLHENERLLLELEEKRSHLRKEGKETEALDAQIYALETSNKYLVGSLEAKSETDRLTNIRLDLENEYQKLVNKGADLDNILKEKLQPLQVQQLEEIIKNIKVDTKLKGAQAGLAVAQAALAKAQEKGIQLDNFVKDHIKNYAMMQASYEEQTARYNRDAAKSGAELIQQQNEAYGTNTTFERIGSAIGSAFSVALTYAIAKGTRGPKPMGKIGFTQY